MKLKISDAQQFVKEFGDQLDTLSGIQKQNDNQLQSLINTQEQSYSYAYYGLSIIKEAPSPLTKYVKGEYVELPIYKEEPLRIRIYISANETHSDKTVLLDKCDLLNIEEKEAIRAIIASPFMESKNIQKKGITYYDVTSNLVINNEEIIINPYKKGFAHFNITNNPLGGAENNTGYHREKLDETWFAELFW
jgi:hypothetical protein